MIAQMGHSFKPEQAAKSGLKQFVCEAMKCYYVILKGKFI